jgi:hypothetical protein
MIIPVEFNFNNHSTLDAFIKRKHNAMPAACVVHTRECFAKYGYWNDKMKGNGDWDMWARILEGGERNNFVFINDPTLLHFIAIWKKTRSQGLVEAEHWLEFYESSDEIPSELLFHFAKGETEQKLIWDVISINPINWTARLRNAVTRVFDLKIIHEEKRIKHLIEIGHDGKYNKLITDSLTTINNLSGELAIKNKEIQVLEKQKKDLDLWLSDIKRSLSWKIGRALTKPFRLLSDAINQN